MNRKILSLGIVISAFVLLFLGCTNYSNLHESELNSEANIFPDYKNVTIPFNIAPLNFIIRDSADKYLVVLKGEKSEVIEILSDDGNIQIPIKKWKKLLNENKGLGYSISIYIEKGSKWFKFNTVNNNIATDVIDNYVVYRFINPANILWSEMGIYQRNIQDFSVSPIMSNKLTDNNCMHCHSFAANNSDNFMLHMRGKPGGTVIYSNNELKFVDTKTEHTISAGGYPAWHPNGKLIAFSNNKINQRFHAVKEKYAYVYDKVSDIVLYDVEKNQIQAIPALSTPDFENIPTWSPNGEYLYFLSSTYHETDTAQYENVKYDLKRIKYNVEKNEWGDVEMLIDSKVLGKSIAFPRVSADNRYVVFCMADYGYFTVYNETSDIAILDLKTGEIASPDINSSSVESYPSWSKNGKWIMFNSKRDDGISSRPYFSYFNNGKAQKAFVLPQEDALWNFEEMNNINRPEFVSSKVPLSPQEILKLVSNEPEKSSFDLSTGLETDHSNSTNDTEAYDPFNFDQ